MIRAIVVVREVGNTQPDYSLEFDLPALPRQGEYLSVQRPDTPEPYGEDLVVRQVWWRLNHPMTSAGETEERAVGNVTEIYVECEPAVGPWSSDAWKRGLSASVESGHTEKFKVSRSVIVSEANLREMNRGN